MGIPLARSQICCAFLQNILNYRGAANSLTNSLTILQYKKRRAFPCAKPMKSLSLRHFVSQGALFGAQLALLIVEFACFSLQNYFWRCVMGVRNNAKVLPLLSAACRCWALCLVS